MAQKEDNRSFKGIIIFLVLLLIALLIFLAFRQGTIIEIRDDPTLETIHTCSSFCRGECFSSFYDRIHAKIFVEGTDIRCVCECTNSLNVWLRGEPLPPKEPAEAAE